MATERQIQANRDNASRSTGPKTDEGKARSRANAVKHGMAGEGGLVTADPAEADAFAKRREAWARTYRPADEAQGWALDRAVAATFRIDRCEAQLKKVIADHANRARTSWHEDRRLEAEAVAKGLSRQPGLVGSKLRASLHGSEILVETWTRLAEALEANGSWTEDEASVALDLLGLPRDLRDGRTPLDPAEGGDVLEHRRALVSREIAHLEARISEAFEPLEELARDHACDGIGAELTPAGRLVQRYESDAWRRYRAALAEVQGAPTPPAEPKPIARPETKPIARAETKPIAAPAPVSVRSHVPDLAPLVPAMTGTSYLNITVGRAPGS